MDNRETPASKTTLFTSSTRATTVPFLIVQLSFLVYMVSQLLILRTDINQFLLTHTIGFRAACLGITFLFYVVYIPVMLGWLKMPLAKRTLAFVATVLGLLALAILIEPAIQAWINMR